MTQRSKIKSFCFMAILGLILGVMAVFCVACNKESVTGITVTGLPENNVAVITDTDNTLQLGYDILGGKGNVEWSSGDNDVASVDASGKVVLIDSGAVVITATLKSNEKIKAEVLLTIKDERTITDTITLSGMPDTNTVQYGDEPLQLSATCSNVQATLVWTSSDMTVATVNDSGLVSFVGGGSTEITVYKKGQRAVKASATLTVIRNVESVTICDIDGGTVVVGYDYRLNEVYEYALQTEYSPWNASAFELEWSVDDTNIATIDENGILTGKQSGRVTVTAQVKDSEVKATKEFDVVALNDRSEDFSYAVANRCIVGSVCADAWVDYTGTKVTSQNTDLFIETYDTNKRMLRVEKNTDWVHWSHICLGSWNLVPGKYILTLDMEVINGAFEGKINGAQYNSTPAEYEHGIRPDAIGELAFGALSQFKAENGQYVIGFELTKSYENFGIMLYDSVSQDPYALNIKSFSLSVADFAVDTDIYSDGMLILGEEYKFVPAAIADGMTFNYKFKGNENGIVELKDGKLIPKKVGNNVKLTVSTDYNGNKLTKEFNLSVIANPFNENEDDYSYAVDVTNRGNLVYDVMRTSVYLRTHNWIMSIEDYNNGKTLKLKKDYAPAWDGSVQFMLGKVKKGTYKVTFTLHGDDVASTDKFNGYIYPIILKEGWQTTFTKDGAYIRGNAPYGSIHDSNCVKNGNSYTYTITVAEDTENFGIELCGGTTVDYTLYLDAFKFEGLSDIDEAQITSPLDGANIKSGEVTNLTANVTYEGGASVGQVYETEWSVAPATNNGGSARIVDGENGTKQLQGLKPGNVILTFTVTSATGKVIKQTVELTIELGELAIDTDMYSDGILVKGKEYKFEPILLIDGMTFEYSYKAQDGTTDAPGIVEVVDGKLIAKSAGTVKLIVSSSIDGAPISKTIEITVKEYGGWEDANYADATKVKELGSNVYSIERTNVYLRTYNMKIAKDGNSLALSKDHLPHGWSEVVLNLGHVEKGTYAVSFELTGTDFVSAKFSGHVKTVTWVHGYESIFTTGAYTDGDILDKTVYQGAVNGNVYTLYVTVTEAQDNFGIALCSNTTVAYTVNLNSFKFEKLPTVTDVEIQTDLETTIKTGEQANLNVSVTYEGGASKGQEYTAEWKTSGEGKVRIAEDGTLTAVAPGSVTIELNVVCADGKTFQKTLTVTVEVGEISIETDMYDDGLLVKGAEYSFVPEKFTDESVFEYSYSADGIVKVENGKLTALKTGDVTVTVTETVTGAKKEISVKVKEYGGWEDANYADATDARNRVDGGTCIYDVARTNVYLRTFNLTAAVEDYNDGKTLKLAQGYQTAWAGSVLFMLGDVKKGTYAVSFTLHGSDIGNWSKFQGHIYPITWSENYKTTFSAEAYSRRVTDPYGNIFDANCVKQGNTYTYTITITEDISNFGIELCGGEPMGYTVYLDAFKFEKLPAVTGVEIQTDLETTIKTGEQANLNVSVTYEGGASKGQEYTAEWKTSGEGTIRIAEDGTLTAVAPGSVTIELNVVCADGKTFQKTLTVRVEVGEISIETDMYDDGLLVKGAEYSFVPEKFTDESVFEYSYSADGIVKVENGKLTALKTGDVTVTVTETVTGAKKEISIKVKEYGGWEDANYADATNAKNRVESGTCIYDVARTNVYLRTFNLSVTVEDYNDGKTLKLAQGFQAPWAGSALFMLGDVTKGTYEVSFTLHGSDIGNWSKFQGFIYPITWSENYKTTFSAEAYSRRVTDPYGNIFDANCVKQGNTYTYTITITEDISNFGIELCGGEPMGYTFYLDAFKFEKLPVVTGAEMNVILTDNKMQTGDKVDLAETVKYAEGATKGENYIAEWSVENGTGTARIESGKLVAVSAGNVTLKLHVVSASGAEFDKSLNITIELGEVIVEHDMYEDGILVKDKEYKFEPQKFSDDSVFEYSYSVENIVKVENGKLIAIGVGNVTLTVTETVTSATKVFELQVVDFSGTKDDDYSYAINPAQHGDFFDIERTGVYLRTFNMRIEKTEDNKLTLTKNYVPAGGASVLFYLGNVEAGRYCITVNLGGDLTWNKFKGYLYPLNMKSGWQTTFGDGAYTKGSEPYGNIHTAGFCLYSGESSTAGGTYKMFIDVASAQTDFGLMLETWETENTSFAITLGSFSFERQELSKTPDFNNASVYKHGEGITVTGSNGSMAVTKAATEASVTETGALRVVTPNTWSEIALCFGKVQAGTYTLTLDISAVDMSGNYWFTGLVYYGTCKNGNISYDGTTGLVSSNAAEVTHAATAKTVSLNITLAEDIENFAIILASKGGCGQAVNVALSNISLVGNTEA